MREAPLLHDVLLAIGSRWSNVRAFRMNVGKARDPLTGQVVTFNTPGMGDVLVLVGPFYLWIETKSSRGTQRENQRRFEAMVRAAGGHYLLARTVDQAVAVVEELLALAERLAA